MKNEGFDNEFSTGRNILTNFFFNKYENSSRAEVVTERVISDSLKRCSKVNHGNPCQSSIFSVIHYSI
jgi:hypothetical protein